MKKIHLIISVFLSLALFSATFASHEQPRGQLNDKLAQAQQNISQNCSPYEKYFPSQEIRNIWGKSVPIFRVRVGDKQIYEQKAAEFSETQRNLNITGPNSYEEVLKKLGLIQGLARWANCSIEFGSPLQESLAISYYEFNDQGTARKYYQEEKQDPIEGNTNVKYSIVENNSIGDQQAIVTTEIVGDIPATQLRMIRLNNFIVTLFYTAKSEAKGEAVAKIVVGNVDLSIIPNLTPSISPTASLPAASEEKRPIITSFTPTSIPAGELNVIDDNGIARYKSIAKTITIKGQNLQGAILTHDNISRNGEQGIEFRNISVREKGKKVVAHMVVHPSAKGGETKITLTNQYGLSASFSIKVTISGTQYLERNLAGEKVVLIGDWPELAPNPDVTKIEAEIRKGVGLINRGSYNRLNIVTYFVASDLWSQDLCGADKKESVILGCAYKGDSIIFVRHVRGNEKNISETILHEAIHKLHFYLNGQYGAVPKPVLYSSFHFEWFAAASPTGVANCSLYLPLKNPVTWKDGAQNTPHCGFAQPYGAFDLDKFYEDVATQGEENTFRSTELTAHPEWKKDIRYAKKLQLLKKYEFIY